MTFRRWLSLVLFCVMSVFITLNDLRAEQGTAEKSSSKSSSSEVVFAVGEWPPMVTEAMAGFGKHARRVTEIFNAMGYHVKFDFLSWPQSMELTRRGEYVGTFPWLKTPDRARDFLVPRYPIAQSYQKGFYKKTRFAQGLDVNRFEDLLTLGVRPVGIASYWQKDEFIRLGTEADIVANPESAWRFLDAGRADILFEEEEVGWLDLIRILGSDATQTFVTTQPVTTDPLFLLFSSNHPDGQRLKRKFEAFMDTAKGQSICARWHICEMDVAEHN